VNDGVSNTRSVATDHLCQIVLNQQLLCKFKKSKQNHAKMKPHKTRPAAGLILPDIHKHKTTGGKIHIVTLLNSQTFCMEGQCLTHHQTGTPAAFLSGTINKLHYYKRDCRLLPLCS